eukprot:CAMPEP_0170884316 /NCGR_PEP_ID=MMETSP0734-20130129/34912_1 /TAXON_ID=186038 /ORGANISM="Fragilariopsis kerguelensis, Strain L26-C5" /LENGTH=81 /DNA_ID=CAMNT_0011268915 /DNA_START=280 /DNA_END=525 /DNA_ORIENTATION=+
MTHEERLKHIARYQGSGMGLIVAGIGGSIGLTGGLWGSIGAYAILVGIGSMVGLFGAGCSMFGMQKKLAAWDAEIMENAEP